MRVTSDLIRSGSCLRPSARRITPACRIKISLRLAPPNPSARVPFFPPFVCITTQRQRPNRCRRGLGFRERSTSPSITRLMMVMVAIPRSLLPFSFGPDRYFLRVFPSRFTSGCFFFYPFDLKFRARFVSRWRECYPFFLLSFVLYYLMNKDCSDEPIHLSNSPFFSCGHRDGSRN